MGENKPSLTLITVVTILAFCHATNTLISKRMPCSTLTGVYNESTSRSLPNLYQGKNEGADKYTGEKDGLIILCAALIRRGEYQSALAELQKIHDNNLLVLIVEKAYDGQIENFENITKFIEILPQKWQAALAYRALFEVMKVYHNLDNVKVLLFYDLVERGGYSIVQELLEAPRKNIITQWANKIRHADFTPVLDFQKKNPDTFNGIFQLLIETTYGANTIYVSRILEFIKKLNKSVDKGRGYTYLYELMKRRNELDSSKLVDLAYFIKSDFDGANKDFVDLKRQLPSGIVSLLWSNSVELETKRHAGYTLYGSNPGNIYVYPKYNYEGGKNQMWRVEREYTAGTCYFRFNNEQNDGVLQNGGDTADNDDRIIRGGDRDKQFWVIVPVEKGAYFAIKDKAAGKWLDYGKLVGCSSSRSGYCSRVLMSTTFNGDSKRWKINKVK